MILGIIDKNDNATCHKPGINGAKRYFCIIMVIGLKHKRHHQQLSFSAMSYNGANYCSKNRNRVVRIGQAK